MSPTKGAGDILHSMEASHLYIHTYVPLPVLVHSKSSGRISTIQHRSKAKITFKFTLTFLEPSLNLLGGLQPNLTGESLEALDVPFG